MNIPRKATEIRWDVLCIWEYWINIRNFEFTLYWEITRSLISEVLEWQWIKWILDFDYDEINIFSVN